MADELNRPRSNNMMLGFLLGTALVGLGVLGYFYYQHTQREVVRIDLPGFSGTFTKDPGGAGFSGEIRKNKDKGVEVEVGKD